MAKELTHRASELKDLGWSDTDLQRYIELWDYRQRWGAINLERDDRQFLRKADAALPVIQTSKSSVKKPIREKSYYCRIAFFLNEMNEAEKNFNLSNDSRGVWAILLEEELRALDYFQPVLGLPDTLKAKTLNSVRDHLVQTALSKYAESIKTCSFDFNSGLLMLQKQGSNKSWHPLREEASNEDKIYPVLSGKSVSAFRSLAREQILAIIRNNFPSLANTDKQNPSEDWIPESNS